jgi:hypothetical protein
MADMTVFAWTGTNNKLNVQVGNNKTVLTEKSCNSPSIAYVNGMYYLAWTDTDNVLKVSQSTNGQNWTPLAKATGQSSYCGPILAVSPDKILYLGWVGTNGQLNYMQWINSQWQPSTTSDQTSNKLFSLIVLTQP